MDTPASYLGLSNVTTVPIVANDVIDFTVDYLVDSEKIVIIPALEPIKMLEY